MPNESQDEGVGLLLDAKIHDFNRWRMDTKNFMVKIDISGRTFLAEIFPGVSQWCFLYRNRFSGTAIYRR